MIKQTPIKLSTTVHQSQLEEVKINANYRLGEDINSTYIWKDFISKISENLYWIFFSNMPTSLKIVEKLEQELCKCEFQNGQ